MGYLLLRNNKETGPFALTDLVQMGLKAYDLVWVEGKSAAWRYPSEVEELKAYAPAVEEQPFDRFYKKTPVPALLPEIQEQVLVKPAESIQETTRPVQTPSKTEQYSNELEKYQPAEIPEEHQPYLPKKSVFVTMPAQKKVLVQSPVQVKPEPKPMQPVMESFSAGSNAIGIDDDEVETKVKYSKPLDEIKEMYVKTLQERKSRKINSVALRNNLKKVAIIAGLIGVGVLAGFIIRSGSDTNVEPAKLAVNHVQPVQDTQETVTDDAAPVSTEPLPPSPPASKMLTPPVEEKKELLLESMTPDPRKAVAEKEPAIVPQTKTNTVAKTASPQEEIPEETYSYSGVEKNAVTGERNKNVRTPGSDKTVHVEDKAVTKNTGAGSSALSEKVTVTSNDYKRVAFGGIRDLRLTVTNNSKYELDNVIVEVQYLKPSEQPLKVEKVQFRGIQANESSTIRVPDTNRGIKVTYRIISIGSKQFRDAVAGR